MTAVRTVFLDAQKEQIQSSLLHCASKKWKGSWPKVQGIEREEKTRPFSTFNNHAR